MKDKILRLRSEGKTYNEISKILGIGKSHISYYCGDNQKEKWNIRLKKHRNKNILSKKLGAFKSRKRKLSVASRDFQRRDGSKLLNKAEKYDFDYNDIIKKFGIETTCYLSGEKINLMEDNNYSLDHIIPCTKDGDNSIDNMGILHLKVNYMKRDMSVDEFISWCKKILEHNGYKVKK
jgi:CRISPR/Cas system Type II protein with McrA/HNH and RuvC-like nuclease domain